MHRLSERQTKASRVLAQNGLAAATAALEAVCAQLDFVRSLRELYSAELAAHVASYNLVSFRQTISPLSASHAALLQSQSLNRVVIYRMKLQDLHMSSTLASGGHAGAS